VRPLYEAGDYEAVAERLNATVGDHPYAFINYNLACVESLAGRKQDAIEHLSRAIALSERFREYAAGDSDFDAIRDEPAFKSLIGS
jgi:tetratricopeptide (TPR) repeat protein